MIPIVGPGTREADWQAWNVPFRWPLLDLAEPPPRVVVLAPHPDDEVLGVGGLLALLAAGGSEITVVAVTDGEASHPGSPTLSPSDLVIRRADERTAALRRLGLAACSVRRLGLSDGGVAGSEHVLTAEMTAMLDPTDWVLATWAGDGHPDHEATGRAATIAAGHVGARLLTYPVWAWHWAVPDDARVPWRHARQVPLTRDLTTAKRSAAAEYRTQVLPLSDDPADAAVLPPATLDRLLREAETVFV